MAHEILSNNEAAPTRDVVTNGKERTNNLTDMMLSLCTDGQGIPSFAWRRYISSAISLSHFRRFDLLGILASQYKGDIPLAVRDGLPSPSGKPLLSLDKPHWTDPIYQQWSDREDQIESRYGARRWDGRTPEYEARDGSRILANIQPGEHVAQLLGWYDAETLASLMNAVGKDGKVYCVSTAPHLAEQLYVNFARHKNRLPQSVASALRNQVRFYGALDNYFQDEEVERFYKRINIVPLHQRPPKLPPEIRSFSLDVIIQTDGFARVPEENKEELLWETDRVLKPGGRILMRDSSRQLATIEYYGQDVFANYRRMQITGLKQPYRWIFLQKADQGPSERFFVSRISTEDETTEKAEPTNGHADIVLTERDQLITDIRASGLDERLSLSWFRSKGYLPILRKEFQGNIDKALDAARNTQQELKIPEAKPIIRPPDGAKSTYTLGDIAQELQVPIGVVRKMAEANGYKISRSPQRKQGGFSSQLRQFQFSYQEYVVVRDILRNQAAKIKNGGNK